MELPERAARALEVLRREGRELRFDVARVCESQRYRLSARYRSEAGEVRLGLVYSEDEEALEALRRRLDAQWARGGSPRGP
jgi:hypothetical protein